MENIIIEASQRQGTKVSENDGDYKVNFSKGYYIYEGDEVAVSKVFIDNKTSSDGIIRIDNDLNITGTIALYTTNNDTSKVNSYTGQAINDNEDYFLSSLTQNTHPNYPNIVRINSFFVFANDRKKNYGSSTTQPLNITYLDILGQKKNFFLDVPLVQNNGGNVFTNVDLVPPILITSGSLKVDDTNGNFEKNNVFPSISENIPNPPENANTGIAVRSRDENIQLNRSIITPVNFPFQFGISKGNYLPQDLALLINDKLTINSETTSFTAGNQIISPFFKTFTQAVQGILNPRMVSSRDKPENLFIMNGNYWIGSSLLDLEFDTSDNKFYWNFLHQPLYSNQSNSTQIVPREIQGGLINKRKNGGVVFTNFDCTETIVDDLGNQSERPFDFLEGVLKFNKHTLIANETEKSDFTAGAVILHANLIQTADKITSTNAKNNLDGLVDKSNGLICPTTNFNPITTTENDIIKANGQAVSGNILDTGYYLINVNCGFKNTLVDSQKISQNINSIVSRYYSLGSYTQGELDPSMIYTHRGEPILLSEAHITIMNPDKTISNVGSDNSVFIEIVRGEFYRQMILEQSEENQKK